MDAAHLVKSGVSDIAEVLRCFRSVVDNLHLKHDAGGEFRVRGRGKIDLARMVSAFREIGYGGWLCTDEGIGADLPDAMESCRQFITFRLHGRGGTDGNETRG